MQKNFVCFWSFLVIAILIFSFNLKAAELNVTSDKMEAFENEGLIVFTGHVFAKRTEFKIWCDKMYVYYTSENGTRTVKKIVALGKVTIEKGNWKGYANKAVYFKDEEKLVLEDNPKVWYNKNLIEGDIVIIYFNEDRSEILAKEQGRVKATVHFK